MALLERRFGIGHEILVHLYADVIDVADRTLVEQFADVTDQRILDVIVAEDSHFSGGFGGGEHLFGVRQIGRHRLLAPDMLAGRQRRRRHLQMELVRCGDGDDVDLGVGHDLSPVTGGALEAELAGLRLRQRLIGVAEMEELHARHVAKYGADRIPGERVRLAHETTADQADADRVLRHTPSSANRRPHLAADATGTISQLLLYDGTFIPSPPRCVKMELKARLEARFRRATGLEKKSPARRQRARNNCDLNTTVGGKVPQRTKRPRRIRISVIIGGVFGPKLTRRSPDIHDRALHSRSNRKGHPTGTPGQGR
jgi:hypothetical protein